LAQKFICEWTSYFENLLALDQERFELEILLFFEDCNYDWHEIDHRIEHLPQELKLRVINRVETMRENTIVKMTKNLHTIFMFSTMLIIVVALLIAFALSQTVAIHFAAIGMMGLLLIVMIGHRWIRRK